MIENDEPEATPNIVHADEKQSALLQTIATKAIVSAQEATPCGCE